MRVGAAALAGGLFGVAGTLCFLLAFGTDYWLVASDDCGPYSWPREGTEANGTEVRRSLNLLVSCHQHNWRCNLLVVVFHNTNTQRVAL